MHFAQWQSSKLSHTICPSNTSLMSCFRNARLYNLSDTHEHLFCSVRMDNGVVLAILRKSYNANANPWDSQFHPLPNPSTRPPGKCYLSPQCNPLPPPLMHSIPSAILPFLSQVFIFFDDYGEKMHRSVSLLRLILNQVLQLDKKGIGSQK